MSREAEWSLSQIYQELRRRAVAGEDLGALAVERRARGLLEAARKHCGSWAAALEAAAQRYPQVDALARAAEAAIQGAGARTMRPVEGPGAELRARRVELGLSQSQAAQRAGVSQGTWALYESGARGMVPPPKAWAALSTDAPVDPAPPRGRPRTVEIEPLEGLDDLALAESLGDTSRPGVVRAQRYLAGGAEIPLERLATLARARPELDMRAVVLELARRRAAATR